MPDPTQGIDLQALWQMLRQMATQSPGGPQGAAANGPAPMGPPAIAQTPDPQEANLIQMMQQIQMMMAQSPQQGQNALAGQQGAMFGSLGGRPPGS